jgi:hypothetical protein
MSASMKNQFFLKKMVEPRSRPVGLRSEPTAATAFELPSLHRVVEEADAELMVVCKLTRARG